MIDWPVACCGEPFPALRYAVMNSTLTVVCETPCSYDYPSARRSDSEELMRERSPRESESSRRSTGEPPPIRTNARDPQRDDTGPLIRGLSLERPVPNHCDVVCARDNSLQLQHAPQTYGKAQDIASRHERSN